MTYQVKNRFQSLPFKFNLQRYTEAQVGGPIGLIADGDIIEVGGCTGRMQSTHSARKRLASTLEPAP
jgi:hypothetical protein